MTKQRSEEKKNRGGERTNKIGRDILYIALIILSFLMIASVLLLFQVMDSLPDIFSIPLKSFTAINFIAVVGIGAYLLDKYNCLKQKHIVNIRFLLDFLFAFDLVFVVTIINSPVIGFIGAIIIGLIAFFLDYFRPVIPIFTEWMKRNSGPTFVVVLIATAIVSVWNSISNLVIGGELVDCIIIALGVTLVILFTIEIKYGK